MVFNATFNNISIISWRSVLLVEVTGVPGENHRPVASNQIGKRPTTAVPSKSIIQKRLKKNND
jgi:hypothetical protein